MKQLNSEQKRYSKNKVKRRLLKRIERNLIDNQIDIRTFQSSLDRLPKTVLKKKQKSKLLSKR